MSSAISRLSTAGGRVGCGDPDAIYGVTNNVIAKSDVAHHAGRTLAVLVFRVKQDGCTLLRLCPAVFEDVSFNQFANRVLGFVEILHRKLSSQEAGMFMPPGERLTHVIVAELDVGQSGIGATAAPKHIFPGRLQEIVHDFYRANAGDGPDGRRVRSVGRSLGMNVGNEGIDDGNVGTGFEDDSFNVFASG
jgi:hypothetical protein